jgi:hypothetical protein
MTRKRRGGIAFLLAGLVLVGLVAMPNPVIADVQVRVYVPVPAPPPPLEVIGVAPSRRHVWIPGYPLGRQGARLGPGPLGREAPGARSLGGRPLGQAPAGLLLDRWPLALNHVESTMTGE